MGYPIAIAITYVVGLASSLAATGIWWSARQRAKQRELARSPFGEVLNFNRDRKVIFVFPTRPPDPEQPRPFRQVGMEDMLAMNFVARSLGLAGWSDHNIVYRTSEQFETTLASPRHDNHDDERDENVVLICMSRANEAARRTLKELRAKNVVECEFDQVPGTPDRWMIKFYGSDIYSESYDIEEAMIRRGLTFREGTVTDSALLAKVNNPWSRRETKMLIVAGIRGIGTWGAGQHIRQQIEDIHKQAGTRNFAWIVRSTYNNWEIVKTEGTPHLKILER
jgi:hypothetical protein